MVDINNIGNTLDQFRDIDSKITLRLIKEKKTSRTYIEGLEKFMSLEEIAKLISKMKKQLGTGSVEKEIQENKKTIKIYGFGGDHRETIKEELINLAIAEDKIDIKA